MHRTAVLTAVVALAPIVVGALVTTLNAGMAFRDWPSSDGWFMLAYPWLADLVRGAVDKFVEHGHRLAGVLVGIASIALATVAWRKEPRRWVRLTAAAVLAAVVAQGALGGARVLFDQRGLALLHGTLASLVFSLMAVVALVTSRGWHAAADVRNPEEAGWLKPLAVGCVLAVLLQSIVGGLVRHLGTGLFEHLVFAGVSFASVLLTCLAVRISGLVPLRRAARWMLLVAIVQVLLGGGAWLNKYGFPPAGYVAVHGTTPHIVFRTAHAVVGMLLLMTAVRLTVLVFRLDWLAARLAAGPTIVAAPLPRGANPIGELAEGGAR
ncbi:MAG: COX15/CtaA family protein [Planctomycetes bacterium]|nr:COX15/CtaA family protein [Planctomycetota bacterium]